MSLFGALLKTAVNVVVLPVAVVADVVTGAPIMTGESFTLKQAEKTINDIDREV